MADTSSFENDFLNQVAAIVEKNISNEQFGVSDLADQMNMSRSNLLRKVKKETNLSVSQLIRDLRLKRGLELLRTTSKNVSEVSHDVGFSSTSYFIKCFREYYGFPPGELGKRDAQELPPMPVARPRPWYKNRLAAVAGGLIAVSLGIFYYYYRVASPSPVATEKSVAVLPFKNDSGDSTNVYLINGLMEATLNNLQKIEDLRVTSRTSAEKYRNTAKSIPEMHRELNVNYFVEGSGQRIGDEILLNIQLIEGPTDRHLWAKQYKREAKDIFNLQQEIARDIADEIQAIITPEEEKRIEKNPTKNLVAYDNYLKGCEYFQKGGRENLETAIGLFQKAIDHDSEFALAYAETAMVYYYLDMFQKEQKYGVEINTYADKALLFDAKLPNSMVAKAMYYMHEKKYDLAVPHLEKALEYNPNSVLVINFLSDVYNNYIPNTGKYLEYALKGVKLNIAAHDSAIASINLLHLSNALAQAGFIKEARSYIDQSLAYNPDNFFSRWVRAFILYGQSNDLQQTKRLLIEELQRDTTQLLMMEEIGKVCYMMRDYEEAYRYYKRFIEIREMQQLDIFKHESIKIAVVLAKTGRHEKAKEYLAAYKQFVDNDKSIYHNLHLAGYHAYTGNASKAIECLKVFSKEDNFQYWILLMRTDPLVDEIKDHPEFDEAMRAIETKFWANHKKLKATLEEKGLL